MNTDKKHALNARYYSALEEASEANDKELRKNLVLEGVSTSTISVLINKRYKSAIGSLLGGAILRACKKTVKEFQQVS